MGTFNKIIICISIIYVSISHAFSQNNFSKILSYSENTQFSESCPEFIQIPEKGTFYSHRVVLDPQETISKVTLQANQVYSKPPFSAESITSEDFFIDWKFLQSDKKGNHFILLIHPLRRNSSRIEALLSFEIEIETSKFLPSLKTGQSFPTTSVLSEGDIYKIGLTKDGVYKIDKSFLESLGVNVTNLNPQSINIYGNGGSLLPELNSINKANDPQKNAIFISGENDGVFNANDYILFYGKGPDTWELKYNSTLGRKRWVHKKHYYSDTAYYFLKINDIDPLRISSGGTSDPANQTSSTFQDFQYIENDIYNLAKGGREFYGDLFDQVLSASYPFSFQNISTTSPASSEVACVARTIGANSTFTSSVQGNTASTSIGFVYDSPTSLVARTGTVIQSFTPNSANCNVSLVFSKGNSEAKGWLDYILLNASRSLTMSGSQMRFRDTTTVGIGNITEFTLANATGNIEIWDVSQFLTPIRMGLSVNAGNAVWKTSTDTLHEFIAFSNFLTPAPLGKIENQNIHSWENVDLVIISSPPYIDVANEIKTIHEAEGQTVQLATPEQIFNEFSSGTPDAMAFRQVMLMLNKRGEVSGFYPKNLLLVGDGDYSRNKGLANQKGNTLLVYESDNSLSPTSSYVSDDYFVMLSDNEDGNSIGLLDCGVGRIP
ncbi:MAG: C25 family cysteine peptidase, partial [Bacteroidota bacterium]